MGHMSRRGLERVDPAHLFARTRSHFTRKAVYWKPIRHGLPDVASNKCHKKFSGLTQGPPDFLGLCTYCTSYKKLRVVRNSMSVLGSFCVIVLCISYQLHLSVKP